MRDYRPVFVEATTLAEGWEKAVRAMMETGKERFIKAPEYQTTTYDLPMIIHVKEPFREPRLHPKTLLGRAEAEEYAKSLVHGSRGEENKFDYTYYSRLRSYPDLAERADLTNLSEGEEQISGKVIRIDQVQKAIDTLKKDPTRRSIVLCTWIVARDSEKFGKRAKSSSPCLVTAHPQIVDDKLHFFVTMKTNDLYNGWPQNAYAFTALQKHIADSVGVGVGAYTHFSISMQVYEEMFEEAKQMLGI
jgi:thymidylate synthase